MGGKYQQVETVVMKLPTPEQSTKAYIMCRECKTFKQWKVTDAIVLWAEGNSV
jgi:hypothetical protein